jgi:hypothetical protein
VFGGEFEVDGLVAAPLAIATGAVTIIAGLVAVNAAVGHLRFAIVANVLGIAALAAACLVVGGRDGAGASTVAWAVVPVSVATMLVLGAEVLARHGGLVEWGRSGGGLVVGALAALPPLLVADDLVRTVVAGVCGVAWLVVVVRSGLVDASRRQADGVALETP